MTDEMAVGRSSVFWLQLFCAQFPLSPKVADLRIPDALEGSRIAPQLKSFSESAPPQQPKILNVLLIIYQSESVLRRIALQKTDRMPRKRPHPGSDPGRSSSTSTPRRTRKSARRRRPASAHSRPPQIAPVGYSLFHRIGVRRDAPPVDRRRHQRRRDGARLIVPQRAMNPPDKTPDGRPGRNRPRRFLFTDLVRLSSLPPQ
jgi:hypothetical protein